MANTHIAVQTEGLSFALPFRQVLVDVALSLPVATITSLVGLNGAGKSTLLRCLAGVEPRYTGCIRILGHDSRKEPLKTRRILGFLSDTFGFPNGQTVGQFLEYMAGLRGFSGLALKDTVMQTRDMMSFSSDIWGMTTTSLSGGVRQRVALAGALVHQPRVLLLDEPTALLDTAARRELFAVLDMLRDNSVTVLLSIPNTEDAAMVTDNTILLAAGRMIDADASWPKDKDSVQARRIQLQVVGEAATYQSLVSECTGIKTVRCYHDAMRLEFRASDADLSKLIRLLVLKKMPIVSFNVRAYTVDDDLQTVALKS